MVLHWANKLPAAFSLLEFGLVHILIPQDTRLFHVSVPPTKCKSFKMHVCNQHQFHNLLPFRLPEAVKTFSRYPLKLVGMPCDTSQTHLWNIPPRITHTEKVQASKKFLPAGECTQNYTHREIVLHSGLEVFLGGDDAGFRVDLEPAVAAAGFDAVVDVGVGSEVLVGGEHAVKRDVVGTGRHVGDAHAVRALRELRRYVVHVRNGHHDARRRR